MGKLGYASPSGTGFAADGYFYGVSDLVNMWWGDAKYTFNRHAGRRSSRCRAAPSRTPASRISERSTAKPIGAQIGANVTKNIQMTAGYDAIPWKTDTDLLAERT